MGKVWPPDPVIGHPTLGMHIWGWMSPRELEWLRSTAAAMDGIVELGSLHGRSAFALLSGTLNPVYCVDPWDDEEDASFLSFMRNCEQFPHVRPVRARSIQAASMIPEVDMVFIDADHQYESVKADIETWLPKTRKLICGHDYGHDGFQGVKQAVDEIFGDRVQCAEGEWDGDMSIWTVWKSPAT